MSATATGLRNWTRRLHRWVGLLIGLQLLFWTVSGIYFSLVAMEKVRGEDRVLEQPLPNFAFTPLVSPAQLLEALVAREGPSIQVRSVELRKLGERSVYEIHYTVGGRRTRALGDAVEGELLAPISQQQAEAIARRDFSASIPIRRVDYLEELPAAHEYRRGLLPAWRVEFEDANGATIYVDALGGRIGARRNDGWRIFDFMWMLHIADFENRDDFNTLLLQVLSALGIFTILSGFALWCLTTNLFRRKSASLP